MDIILLRHGIAEDVGPDGTDSSRRLTELGIERTTQAVAGLARVIDKPALILTSPKVRAAQTASLLAKAVKYHDEPAIAPVLAGDSPQDIARFLLSLSHPLIVAVGHEPTLSLSAELLCTGSTRLGLFDLKKAGAIGIHVSGPDTPGRLLWNLPPDVLRKIG